MIRSLLFALCWGISALSAQEAPLDPSIFDGSGTEVRESDPEPAAGRGNEEEAGASPAATPTEPGTPGAGETEPSAPAAPPASEPTPDPPASEEGAGTEAESAEEPEDVAAPGPPGSPAPAAQQSRAGESVTTTESIAPGQAVDLPWDM